MNSFGYIMMVVFMGYIIYSYFKDNFLIKNGVKVIGKVISVEHFGSSSESNSILGDIITRATYEFYYNEEKFVVRDRFNGYDKLSVGDEVIIYVNPKKPHSYLTPLKRKSDDSIMIILTALAVLWILFIIFTYLMKI